MTVELDDDALKIVGNSGPGFFHAGTTWEDIPHLDTLCLCSLIIWRSTRPDLFSQNNIRLLLDAALNGRSHGT